MRIIFIKNVSGTTQTWVKEFADNEEYQLQNTAEQEMYVTCDELLQAICNGDALIGDGDGYFTKYAEMLCWLINNAQAATQIEVAGLIKVATEAARLELLPNDQDLVLVKESGLLWRYDSSTEWEIIGGNTVPEGSCGVTIDGGGSEITTGSKGFITIPYTGTITGWVLSADQAGDIEIDVKKSDYSDFPTTTSIAGSELPTLTDQQKNRDIDLTTWTTAVTAGDIIEFVVNSVDVVTRVNLSILINKGV